MGSPVFFAQGVQPDVRFLAVEGGGGGVPVAVAVGTGVRVVVGTDVGVADGVGVGQVSSPLFITKLSKAIFTCLSVNA